MKRTVILVLAASSCAFAQETGNVIYQGTGPAGAVALSSFVKASPAPVKGAPYSATTTNESIQTLADGNRVVQTSNGTIARDSQGRTRQDAPLPPIGNLSPANVPHLVFLQDPAAGTSYTLNLTDETAWKNPIPQAGVGDLGPAVTSAPSFIQMADVAPQANMSQPTTVPSKGLAIVKQEVNTENLGTQTIEGVVVNGVRATSVIAAGQIGNDKPISVVTESGHRPT